MHWKYSPNVLRFFLSGKEHPDTAQSYNNIGLVMQAMGDNGGALKTHKRALVNFEKVLGKEHPDTAQSYSNIGLVMSR